MKKKESTHRNFATKPLLGSPTYCRLIAVGPQQEWPFSRLVPLKCEPTEDTQDALKMMTTFIWWTTSYWILVGAPNGLDWMDYYTTTLPGNDHISHLRSVPSLHLPCRPQPLAVSRGIQRGADLLLGSVITSISKGNTWPARWRSGRFSSKMTLGIHTKQQHQLVHQKPSLSVFIHYFSVKIWCLLDSKQKFTFCML